MEFNLSTFILEIINFLILIWILQRLFYKPLLEVIAKRKQFIDQSLADAKTCNSRRKNNAAFMKTGKSCGSRKNRRLSPHCTSKSKPKEERKWTS